MTSGLEGRPEGGTEKWRNVETENPRNHIVGVKVLSFVEFTVNEFH